MSPYPMAASVVVAPLLGGVPRPVRLAAVTAQAAYLATGHPRLPALCLARPGAVRVPCAMLVGADAPALAADGTTGTVGADRLTVGAFEARVGRWWRPPPLPRLAQVDADRLAAQAADLAARLLEPADPGDAGRSAGDVESLAHSDAGRLVHDGAERLSDALRTGSPPGPAVQALLGQGPGLTPLGDDVLAGALVTLRARRAAAAGPLAAAVATLAGARTTFVSAALLHHAARGECVPELTALLAAIGHDEPLDRALCALLAVGRTSGHGLAHGVRAGLGAAP